MKEFVYGFLILSFAVLFSLYFSYTRPESVTFITILLGSVIAAVGTYIASYRAQKYMQDRSEKSKHTKNIFYPIYRVQESPRVGASVSILYYIITDRFSSDS